MTPRRQAINANRETLPHLGDRQQALPHLSERQRALAHLNAVRQSGLVSEETLQALLQDVVEASQMVSATDLAVLTTEVRCARRLNFLLPNDPGTAIEAIEMAVTDLVGGDQCVVFSFDEHTGIYTCISDEKIMGQRPRELTTLGDGFLETWLGLNRKKAVITHTHLVQDNRLVGLVVVVNAEWPEHLELLAPYLALKIDAFMGLKASLLLPHRQEVLIDLSSRLVSAVDRESIVTETLDVFWSRLGFGLCQYVVLNEQTGDGTVLYENNNGRLKSFFHAGLAGKRHTVKQFASLVSLLSSGWRNRPYLYLSGGQLGDKSLAEVFGVKNAHAVLLLPIIDMKTGKIEATVNLFQTQAVEVSPETIALLGTLMDLVNNALGRSTVLEKALALATRDELTGLLNRRGLYERFGAEIERVRRHPAPMSIAMLDVDHFKKLNDTHGHLSGDAVLRELGRIFASSVRKSDVVCRFGGEEFAILLPETPGATAVELMERVRKRVEDSLMRGIDDTPLSVTISIGVAEVDTAALSDRNAPSSHLDRIAGVLSQADAALYEAKHQGRNRVCQFEDAPSRAV